MTLPPIPRTVLATLYWVIRSQIEDARRKRRDALRLRLLVAEARGTEGEGAWSARQELVALGLLAPGLGRPAGWAGSPVDPLEGSV